MTGTNTTGGRAAGRKFARELVATLVLLAGGPAALQAADPFSDSVPMQQRASGNYYVEGTLSGGIRTDLLVDTGSGYVSLAPAVFERLRAAPGTVFLRDIVGSMANGRSLKVPVYRIERLALSAHCVLHDVEVTVMPGSTRSILGLSALRRVAPFALDLEPARLMLSGCVDESGEVALPEQGAVAATEALAMALRPTDG
jgi:predicted aspartyl protease